MKQSKTVSLLFTALLVGGSLFAQKSKVLSAYNYQKAYQRDKDCSELQKGIQSIEPATKDSKTMDESKTWYYRGNLYFDISISKDKKCQNLAPNATQEAFTSYIESMKLNFKDTSFHHLDLKNKQADAQKFFMGYIYAMQGKQKVENIAWIQDIVINKFPYLENQYYNLGVKAFSQKRDYKAAFEAFSKASMLNGFTAPITKKLDTTAIYNAGLAAQNCKDTSISKEAIGIYKQLIKMGYKGQGATIYLSLADLQMKKGNQKAAEATIADGRKAYPKDNRLVRKMVDYNLQSGNDTTALKNLNVAILNNPHNAVLLYARGAIYDKLKKTDKAEADYKAALADSSDYFDPNYNLGALYFNKGANYNNDANKVPINQTTKYKALKAKAQGEFKKAQPYLEKAHKINPNDMSVVKSLLKVYAMTNQTDKYKALNATLK